MPLNGGGTASKPPGTTFVPNTTVASAPMNSVLDDIYAIFNTPRPIVYGGTNGSSAVEGIDNLSTKGADIASASTTDLSAATGNYVTITGTNTINNLGSSPAGTRRHVRFAGTLIITHNGTSLILPGSTNIRTAAGDIAEFISEGSGNWRCVAYLPSDYTPKRPVLGTAQATTSGSSKDFVIPAGVTRVTVSLVDVSTTGTGSVIIQLGTSGAPETTGYRGTANFNGTNFEFATGSGFYDGAAGAANRRHGAYNLTLADSSTNTWTFNGGIGLSNLLQVGSGYGSKALAGRLDIIRITTADAFDAGLVNVLYE